MFVLPCKNSCRVALIFHYVNGGSALQTYQLKASIINQQLALYAFFGAPDLLDFVTM